MRGRLQRGLDSAGATRIGRLTMAVLSPIVLVFGLLYALSGTGFGWLLAAGGVLMIAGLLPIRSRLTAGGVLFVVGGVLIAAGAVGISEDAVAILWGVPSIAAGMLFLARSSPEPGRPGRSVLTVAAILGSSFLLFFLFALGSSSIGGAGDSDPSWSPDGRLVAYAHAEDRSGTFEKSVRRREIWLVDPAGVDRRRIVDGGAAPDFSAQGQLVFVTEDGLALADLQGEHRRAVPNTAGAADPSWSPGGELIAFASRLGPRGIYVIAPDGTGRRRLTTGADSGPDWSPDGGRIVFAHAAPHELADVTVIGVIGSNRVVLARGDEAASPAWSPDGKTIAYVGPYEVVRGIARIYLVDADGSDGPRATRACPTPQGGDTCRDPAWSPDSKKIAFMGGYEVNGGQLRILELEPKPESALDYDYTLTVEPNSGTVRLEEVAELTVSAPGVPLGVRIPYQICVIGSRGGSDCQQQMLVGGESYTSFTNPGDSWPSRRDPSVTRYRVSLRVGGREVAHRTMTLDRS